MISISTSFAASNTSINNLKSTVNTANNLKEVDYTVDSWEDMQWYCTRAKFMVNNLDNNSSYYSTSEVTDMRNELIIAIDNLVFRSDLDYKVLATTINKGSRLDESKYTVNSWEVFQTIYNDAKILTTTRSAVSQDEIYELDDSLKEAIDSLELRSNLDYDYLEWYFDYANGLDSSKYTSESWNVLKEFLNKSNILLKNKNADSQYTIDYLANDLISTIFDLENKDNTNKINTILFLKIPTIIKGKKTFITTILSDPDGPIANELITIYIDNKEYILTTDENGVATFKIKSLNPGKYNVTAVYEGNDEYASSTATGTQLVKGIADLKITKVKKSGNTYKITIKNQGSANSGKFILRLYCGCKKYTKNVYINSIVKGKSITKLVKFYAHKKHKKYAIVNYTKKVLEAKYKNNKVKI